MANRVRIEEGGKRSLWLREPGLVTAGFLLAILLGCVLLSSAAAAAPGHPALTWRQALFTSASAVCVTGLTVVDTASHLSRYGQTVVLLLIQLGGLGVMTLALLVYQSLRRVMDRETARQSPSTLTRAALLEHPQRTFRLVLIGTLLIETAGFLLLLPALRHETEPAWKALFLSVSAFCNAGFDNLDRGLGAYTGDWGIGLPLMALWLIGGMGFVVPASLFELWRRGGTKRLDPSARMILWATAALVPAGALVFVLCESFNGGVLDGRSLAERTLLALFHGNTTRTAGFSMLNLGELRRITLATMIPFMLLGGAPGGTAGGMKTTTAWIFAATLLARMRGHEQVVVGRRTMPTYVVRRSVLICSLMVLLQGAVTLWLTALEPPSAALAFERLAFEAASALGTVGLSTGITAQLSWMSQCGLIAAMLIGRLGPLTITYALFRNQPEGGLRFPPAEVVVG